MKKKLTLSVVALTSLVLLSQCSSSTVLVQKPLPPGQAKKVAGTQSAKPFAPGQQKKAAGEQSAKGFAPGQQSKSVADTQKSVPPGQAKKKK